MIYELEGMLQDQGLRSRPESISHLLADEFVEFGSSGQIFNKQEILKSISHQVPATFDMEDFKLTQLKPGLVLATYAVTRSNMRDGRGEISLRSSIWVDRDGRWQMLFHQATIVPS